MTVFNNPVYCEDLQFTTAPHNRDCVYQIFGPQEIAAEVYEWQAITSTMVSLSQESGLVHSSAIQTRLTASSAAVRSSSFEYLARGAATINAFLAKDKQFPALGDLTLQGSSNDYAIPTDAQWQPFNRSRIINIPDVIFDQYNTTEVVTTLGLFPEIERAYITVDNRLFLWNFLNGEDFASFEEYPHTITNVKLAKPKKGIFIGTITHVLVLASPNDLHLLGVNKASDGAISLYQTNMSVQTRDMMVVNIATSSDGRIFFSGNDNHIYEILYQSNEGWVTSQCRKICHTSSHFDSFLPSMFLYQDNEKILQIAIDDSRSILYTLSTDNTIRGYQFSSPSKLWHLFDYRYASMVSHAQMLNTPLNLLSPQTTKIVSICPVTAIFSNQVYLVAVTDTQCRLYLRGVKGFMSTNNQILSSIQVSYVTLPPGAQASRIDGQFANSNSSTAYAYKPSKQPLNLSIETTKDQKSSAHESLQLLKTAALFSGNHFFAFHNTKDKMNDQLFASCLDAGKIALEAQSHTKPGFYEVACWVPIEGLVQDVAEISKPTVQNLNELATQFCSGSKQEYAILTNTGIHIIQRQYPLAMLWNAIKKGIGEQDLAHNFLQYFGRAEACAICLAIACGRSAIVTGGNIYQLDLFRSINGQASTVHDPDIRDTAKRLYLDFGGRAVLDESKYNPDRTSLLDNIKLSGRWEGLGVYAARILSPIWFSQIFKSTNEDHVQNQYPMYSLNFAVCQLQNILCDLAALKHFLDNNKAYIEGLSGPANSIAVGHENMDETATQAEHRGMHSLYLIVEYAVQAVEFLFLINDESDGRLHCNILGISSAEERKKCLQLTCEKMIASHEGIDTVKELVNSMINNEVKGGSSVENITSNLRQRCPIYCSGNDVMMYKAIGLIKEAKESKNGIPAQHTLLAESRMLFETSAASLTIENLQEVTEEYNRLKYYQGTVDLILKTAQAHDSSDLALAYPSIAQNKSKEFNASLKDSAEVLFQFKLLCYKIIFATLDKYGSSKEMVDVVHSIYQSEDQLFHRALYDRYVEQGMADQLINLDTTFVRNYLETDAQSDPLKAEILWKWHARRQEWYESACVLYYLATSPFEISIDKRVEFLSRARAFCNCKVETELKPQLLELLHLSEECLHVADIQDQIMQQVNKDTNLESSRQIELCNRLANRFLPLTALYEDFADPLGYQNICEKIYSLAGLTKSNDT